MSNSPRMLSFRDPAAHVVMVDGEIYRAVHASHRKQVASLLQQSWLTSRIKRGQLPETNWCQRPQACEAWGDEWSWLHHQKLQFPLYPHEITMQQLHDSALLTLDLAEEALNAGFLLKDASAWNVLHEDGQPVFCDLTSFVPHDNNPLWMAYAQFGRHFIIPLLLARYLRMNAREIFVLNREGISPEKAFSLLGKLRSASSFAALEFVLMPSIAGRSSSKLSGSTTTHSTQNTEVARRSHATLITRLRHYVKWLDPAQAERHTQWSNYTSTRDHYSVEAVVQKQKFIVNALEAGNGRLLDLGSNTGEYALCAARVGRYVVAADVDEQSLQLLHRAKGALPISTLLLDLANPSPALGWRNSEVAGILSRAVGQFDTILCVGLLHHLLVAARIPLKDILDLLASLRAKEMIIEWINPDDPMFVKLAGLNAGLYSGLSSKLFETVLKEKWHICDAIVLNDKFRIIYHVNLIK